MFQAHRVVLASCSDYFRAMFTDAMRESRQSKICLNGVSAAGIRLLLEYAYTSRLALNLANIQDVLSAASHIQVVAVVEACSNYLQVNYFHYIFFVVLLPLYWELIVLWSFYAGSVRSRKLCRHCYNCRNIFIKSTEEASVPVHVCTFMWVFANSRLSQISSSAAWTLAGLRLPSRLPWSWCTSHSAMLAERCR